MSFSLIRTATGSALTLLVVALPHHRAAAQAPISGVEQARVDSLRRPYTAADIEFMSGMIGHHSQAVKMAGWAESHGASKSLQIFCGRIAMAQTAEIGMMSDWLKDRNQPVPERRPARHEDEHERHGALHDDAGHAHRRADGASSTRRAASSSTACSSRS